MNAPFVFLLMGLYLFFSNAYAENIKQWSVFEKKFSTMTEYTNEQKYKLEFTITFKGPQDIEQTVPGFWDGGSDFKVRFSPTIIGEWTYKVNSSDVLLSANEGSFTCISQTASDLDLNPNNHGFIQISDNRRFLEYADGKPFFWLGGTLWDGNSKNMPLDTDFKYYVNDRKSKGFTVVQILLAEPPDCGVRNTGNNENGYMFTKVWDEINPASCQNLDQRINYVLEQGMVPCLFMHWGRTFRETYNENNEYYYKYIIARYQAQNVIWCVSGEYGYESDVTNARKAGNYIHKTDVLGHMTTIHPGPNPDNYSTLEHFKNEDWIDIHMLQVWWVNLSDHAFNNYNIISGLDIKKPLVFGEGMYDDIGATDRQGFAAWSNYLNGCAGFTYGAFGIWNWTTSSGKAAIDFQGVRETAQAASFLRSTQWEKMIVGRGKVYKLDAMYQTDEEIVINVHGQTNIIVNTAGFSGSMNVKWYNAITNQIIKNEDKVKVGGEVELVSPFKGGTNILYMYKDKEATKAPEIVSHSKTFGKIGETYYYPIFTRNEPNKFEVISLPKGFVLDKAIGQVTGIPAKSGLINFKVIAKNDFGADSLDVVIDVEIPESPNKSALQL